jgi:cysteine desulfurase
MEEVYLDNAATTRAHPKVVETVSSAMMEDYANPSSLHDAGKQASRVLNESRNVLSNHINARNSEIIFTSGGTESDNLALRGVARAYKPEKKHIVISAIEHKAVLNAAEELEREGFDVTRVGVDEKGRVDPRDVESALRSDTALVSVMTVNNEVGTVQPVSEIAKTAHDGGALMHTDAVQAFGKMPLYVEDLDVDLLSLSGHKVHGPKGVGALYVRKGVKLYPTQVGGGQEHGRRAGTENVPGIAGIAKAVKLLSRKMSDRTERIRVLRDQLQQSIASKIGDAVFNGADVERAPHILSVSLKHVEINYLLRRLSSMGVYVTSGSACASESLEPSHVLTAMGLSNDLAHNTVRFSLSGNTTEEEVDYAASCFVEAVQELCGTVPADA